jgi:hypothetical protein
VLAATRVSVGGNGQAMDKAGIIRVASAQNSDGILGVGHTHSKGYTYN